QRLLDGFEDRAPKPWVMLGHSMGAALNLVTLTRGEERFSAAIVINPMLRIRTGKHSLWSVTFQTDWKVKHGQGSDYVPELFDDPFEHTFEDDALTHDAARYNLWREQLFACPHLAVGTPTWGWLLFALRIGETLLKDKGKVLKKIRTPVSVVCSGDDSLMLKGPTKSFTKRLLKGRYVEIAGAEHEILMETDAARKAFWSEFDETVAFNLPPEGVNFAAPVASAEVAVAPAQPAPVAEVFDSAVPAPEAVAEEPVEATELKLAVPDAEDETPAPVVKPALFVSYELSDIPVYAPPLPPERLSSPSESIDIEASDWEERDEEVSDANASPSQGQGRPA
ncbi:MAG: alpha/beta hydrolase, partial [Asticcacaulis sp.]